MLNLKNNWWIQKILLIIEKLENYKVFFIYSETPDNDNE